MSLKPRIGEILVAVILLAVTAIAAELSPDGIFIMRAQEAFVLAQKNYLADTNSAVAALALGHASFDLADLATNETQRADMARTGIAACRQVLARDPKSAPGHYYLAMNLGRLAQAAAPSLIAYRLVREVEREFLTAADFDVRFDHAGPARCLGELYFQAPGWPFSIGSNRKAREWFGYAVALAPEHPGNQLDLAEAQLKWRENDAFAATMKNLDAVWPAAKTNFTGAAWERSWLDWNARRTALTTELQKIPRHAP